MGLVSRDRLVSCPVNNLLNSAADFRDWQGAATSNSQLLRGAATPPDAKRRGELSELFAGHDTSDDGSTDPDSDCALLAEPQWSSKLT